MQPISLLILIVAGLISRTSSAPPASCQADVYFNVDCSASLTSSQFGHLKQMLIKLVDELKLKGRQSHLKLGLASFCESSTISYLQDVDEVKAEIQSLEVKGGKPGLVKSLQLLQSAFSASNGGRDQATDFVITFIGAEPLNVMRCLKLASQMRSSGVHLISVAVLPDMEEEAAEHVMGLQPMPGHHVMAPHQRRDFIDLLGAMSGLPENVVTYNMRHPDQAISEILSMICPNHLADSPLSVEVVVPKEEPKHVAIQAEEPTAEPTVEPAQQETPRVTKRRLRRSTTTPTASTPTVESTTKVVPTTPTMKPTTPTTAEKKVEAPKARVQMPHHDHAHHEHHAQQKPRDLPPVRIHPAERKKSKTTTLVPEVDNTIYVDEQAIAFCHQALAEHGTHDNIQFFADPENCTLFYNCHEEAGQLTAKHFVCTPGMFWKQHLQQCVPGTGCTDICEEPAIARKGTYGDENNCRRFFVCANQVSYQHCCPAGTAFDRELLHCTTNDECEDICEASGSQKHTTVFANATTVTTARPRIDADGSCRDAWGSWKKVIAQSSFKYSVHIGRGAFVSMNCPGGTRFDVDACDCVYNDIEEDGFIEPVLEPIVEEAEAIHCLLYLPLDSDFKDVSPDQRWVKPVADDKAIWIDDKVNKLGAGSARVSSTGLSIPGMQNVDFQDHVTIAFWLKCFSDSIGCTGDLFINGNSHHQPSVRITLRRPQTFEVQLRIQNAEKPMVLEHAIEANSNGHSLLSWTHIAVVYGSSSLSFYVNGTLVEKETISEHQGSRRNIAISPVNVFIASGQLAGQFRGYIDEVGIFANQMTKEQIHSLMHADRKKLAQLGWI